MNIIIDGDKAFYRIANADGKVWYVPRQGMAIALELYQPSGTKGRMLKALLPWLHWFAPVRQVARTEKVKIDLRKDIRDVVGAEMDFAVFGGTPSVHQKATIQLSRHGKIEAYAKVSESPAVVALFEHEQALLDTLQAKGVQNIPRCIDCKELPEGGTIFVQSTVKTKHSSVLHEWTALHDDFLNNLHTRTAFTMPFENSDYANMLADLEQILTRVPDEYRKAISQAMADVRTTWGEEEVTFSAYHADFTPWNMFVENDKLFVFDWEYGRLSYPAMLDRYHFHIQQGIHVYHRSAEEIYDQISAEPWFDGMMLKMYLLDMIARFVGREDGTLSQGLLDNLNIWHSLITKK